MKFRILFIFLLFITLSYSQQACVDVADCTGPDDPICELPTPECLNNVCVYESIPNCCHSNIDCTSVALAPCEKLYFCNATNQCEPELKECENGQPCTDFCFDSEVNCQSRVCTASSDPDIDSTCQIGTIEFECEKPANKCEASWCATGYGCNTYDSCYDGIGCTEDTCPDADAGCLYTPIENCTECEGEGCISNDKCLPSLCLPYFRGGGPSNVCTIVPVDCTIDDPCLINGVCLDGVCEYENICSSESQSQGTTTDDTTTGSPTTTTTTTTTGSASTTTGSATTTTGSASTTTGSASTTTGSATTTTGSASTTTGSVTTTTGSITTTTGGSDSDDYDGPKYPDCLDCKDLDCEKMGKKCKYLKSDKKACDEHHHRRHHKSPKPVCSLKCPPNHQCQIDEFDKQCCVKIECDDICDLNCGRGFECKIKHDGSKCCVKIHKPRPPPPHHKPICSLRCPSNHECKIDEFDKQCCVKIECDDICDLNCGRGFECKIKHNGSKCCVVAGNNHRGHYQNDYDHADRYNQVDYYDDNDDDDDEEFFIYKHKKYPHRLGPSDCCPYTPTCY
ncbi:hypothetical protein ACTFIY_002305 [Dictyostelium cf. discoideum]